MADEYDFIIDDDELINDIDDSELDSDIEYHDGNSSIVKDKRSSSSVSYYIPPGFSNAKTVHSLQIIRDSEDLISYFTNPNTDVSVGRNTWDNFRLIPSSRPVISPPEFRSNFIEIPGADGLLDMSTVLSSGHPLYGRRKGDIEFYVTRDYEGYYTWSKVYTNLMTFLHGQVVKCILMDDPGFYYRGRMTVNQWRSEKDWSKIVLNYDFEPYKYAVFSTADRWLWDPFDFAEGVITDPVDYFGSEGNGFKLINYDDTEAPKFKEFVITAGAMRFSPILVINNEHNHDLWVDLDLELRKKVKLLDGTENWEKITLSNGGRIAFKANKKTKTKATPYFVNVKNGTYKLKVTFVSAQYNEGNVYDSVDDIKVGLLYRYGSL